MAACQEQARYHDETRQPIDVLVRVASHIKVLLVKHRKSIVWLNTIFAICCCSVLWYGSTRYYYGPIEMRDNGFYDPSGGPHSREEFEGFKAWERMVVILWPSLLLLSAGTVWLSNAGKSQVNDKQDTK